MGMSEAPVVTERLDSWKEIASYLGRSVRTVIRWEHEKKLPIHRIPGGHRQAVFAYPREVDEWLQSDCAGSNEDRLSTITEEVPTAALEESPNAHARSGRSWIRNYGGWSLWVIAAVVLLTGGLLAVHSLTAPLQIQFTGIDQLTDDGTSKSGLVTDGERVYFGEQRDGRVVLAEVPVAGGQVRLIPTPFIDAYPQSVSPDGKELLVLDREGEEEERALWIVPTETGSPRRVGAVFCHSAAWSPDGRSIAYASGKGIYLTRDEGATSQEVRGFAQVPRLLHWSPDGKRLRFDLVDGGAGQFSLWDLTFSNEDEPQVASLIPIHISFNRNLTSLVMADDAGHSFFSLDSPSDNRIWFLERPWGMFSSQFAPIELGDQLAGISALALDRSARTLFVLSGVVSDTELLRLDPMTHDFVPFLPGTSAAYVDFSRDGRWIAYVGPGNQSLWISRADDSQKHEIDIQATEIELPRWSPDGRSIAFMARRPDRPWRIFIVPAAGGTPKEASTGFDNQGAPTWSPDGRWLVYGNVNCEEFGTCAIHKIDLSTGKELTVPGSQGMGTARWSPDGRYMAALFMERRQVYLLDLATAKWRKLADEMNGNDLSWSADSRYVYASRASGEKPEILRISVNDGKVESAVDLSAFNNLAGHVDTWFALAPDGSVIFMRWLGQTEIYALHYQAK